MATSPHAAFATVTSLMLTFWQAPDRAMPQPADTPLPKLAQVAATRYTVEQCIEEAKGETGLDDYEVRYWHSWHRHITLSMMAHVWLAAIRCKATAKKGGPSPSWPN